MIDAESGDCSSTDGDPRWSRRLGETAEVDVEIARHIDELCSQPLVSALHCMCDRKLRPQNGYLGYLGSSHGDSIILKRVRTLQRVTCQKQ